MLKETIDANEFEHTMNAINHLTEKDAKSLLKIIYIYVNTAMTGNGGEQAKLEAMRIISDIYKRIPYLNE